MPGDTRKTGAPADPDRRRLLAGAPVAGAAALAAGTGGALVEGREEEPADPREPVYRETDHVRAYYARARG